MEGEDYIPRGQGDPYQSSGAFDTDLCYELLQAIRKPMCQIREPHIHFWWGQKASKRRTHWLGWDKLCISKFYGGMDFKSLKFLT